MRAFSLISIVFVSSMLLSSVKAETQGAVRFVRDGIPDTSQAWLSGIVQIYYSGGWRSICVEIDGEYEDEANVICHQLGYSKANSHSNTEHASKYGVYTDDTAIGEIDCRGSSTFLTITQCYVIDESAIAACENGTAELIVDCDETRIWDSPTIGDIRLTNGSYSNQGRLEIYCNGEWGAVCEENFLNTHATIACKQLGYNAYADFNHLENILGSSSQKIWLESLSTTCSVSGTSCLSDCEFCPSSEYSECDRTSDIVTLECKYDSSGTKAVTEIDDTCDFDLAAFAAAVIIGTIIVIFFCCCIAVLACTIPLCICCCLGVGIGAAVGRSSKKTKTSTVVGNNYNPTTEEIPMK